MEDIAMGKAIEEGESSELVSRDEIFELLEGATDSSSSSGSSGNIA